MLWWLLGALAVAEPSPPDATVVYYNARMALREGEPTEAVQLWLLRNALADQTGMVSVHDDDFRSVTWAALGELGLCQDGLAADRRGAGLWPLATHNWFVRTMNRRGKARRPRPFDAFQLGQQQRFVSITDVLSARELSGVSLTSGACFKKRFVALAAQVPLLKRLDQRPVQAQILTHLLRQAEGTLGDDVIGRSVLSARLFDLHLEATALAEREAREEARKRARTGRSIGIPRDTVAAMADDDDPYPFADDSEPARILRAALSWSVDEWMALESERRRFVFDHARGYHGDPHVLDPTAEAVLSRLATAGEGAEVQRWVARRAAADEPANQRLITSGPLGEQLLALEPATGFTERSVVALHRGVQQLEAGALPEALRSFAFALHHANESRSSEAVAGLSRRWLSYVAGQFVVTDELLVTLQELVPRREYGVLLEDLLWRAALHADSTSFERAVRHLPNRGALARRAEHLTPLAAGDLGGFATRLRDGLGTSPSETLRFIDQFLQRVEREDATIRAAQAPTLRQLDRLLVPLADPEARGRSARVADELQRRIQAVLEGLADLEDPSARERARALAPGSEVFAGSVRLAPSDTLPWPFTVDKPSAPSVYSPLSLTPVEWLDGDGERVYGWSIGG